MARAFTTLNYRPRRRKVKSPAFSRSPVLQTNQSVTPTGAAIAIRPKTTSLRRMDTRGQGTVGYF